ncbi:GL24637 [Drosophila persimilis]|uniref:GL24637 n=1 Tax=Drosophila persimilis TaxID=7234 RepID=B4H5S9_DROPE|nr:GL24637 [Drosophila persimilis]
MNLPSKVHSVRTRLVAMFSMPDLLALACLWASGFSLGYYSKSAYVYDNLWPHWYALVGGAVTLALALGWTLRKHKRQKYSYDHYYVIFYGLLCSLMGSCFMLTKQLAVSYYFHFVGLSVVIALANALHACGLASGFVVFNEMEPQRCGLITLGIDLLLVSVVCLKRAAAAPWGCHKLTRSRRDPGLSTCWNERAEWVFLPRQAAARNKFGGVRTELPAAGRQAVAGLVLGGFLVVLQRSCPAPSSPTYLQLMWSCHTGYVQRTQLFTPFVLYGRRLWSRGSAADALHPQAGVPPLWSHPSHADRGPAVHLQRGAVGALLPLPVPSSYATVGVPLQPGPPLAARVLALPLHGAGLATGFVLQLGILEGHKYEANVDDTWTALLAVSVVSLVLTSLAVPVVQWLQPYSASLVDVRNRLLGIRRLSSAAEQTQFWATNHFLAHNKPPHELQSVRLSKSRIFQQYPISGLIDTPDSPKLKF